MASTAKIVRNQRRQKIVEQYAERRAALKQAIASPQTPPEVREAAQAALRRQPRDASATRLRNRDAIDGRPRGFLRKAGLSRVRFRQLALRGELPGVHKASW